MATHTSSEQIQDVCQPEPNPEATDHDVNFQPEVNARPDALLVATAIYPILAQLVLDPLLKRQPMAEMRVLVMAILISKLRRNTKAGNKIQTDQMRSSVLKLAEERKPDLIAVMGDLLDRFARIHAVPLTDAISWLYRLAEIAMVILLIGNHDRPTQDDFLSDYHPFSVFEIKPTS